MAGRGGVQDLARRILAVGVPTVGVLLVLGALVYAGVLAGREPQGSLAVSPLAPPAAAPPRAEPSGAQQRTQQRRPAQAPARVDPGWVRTTAEAAGIPQPALRAYADAQLARPAGCEVGWTTLAGIGWVESHHGTLGDRMLGADGRSEPAIIGPALDGDGVKAIHSTPETQVWHGDPVWDHAVGPMQFLPSTWERWGRDGDGDGVADPNDLDDAALASMGYLCADGHDLTSGDGWADAVFGYNHAQSYVDAVYAAATAYAERTA